MVHNAVFKCSESCFCVSSTHVLLLSDAGKKPVPAEFDNEIMSLLKEFTKNAHKESRISQPPLPETTE